MVFTKSLPLKEKEVGVDLFSRSVARQVSSAPHSLTSVFGMGTGGPCAIKTPTAVPAVATFELVKFNLLNSFDNVEPQHLNIFTFRL